MGQIKKTSRYILFKQEGTKNHLTLLSLQDFFLFAVREQIPWASIVDSDWRRMSDTHLTLLNVAADIKEVGRLTAVQLDDVHGGHGQPCTVHQATDVPVHLYTGQ
jgi:hypothetical protein